VYKMGNNKEKTNSVEEVQGPTGEIPELIYKFLEFTGEVAYIPGEKLELEGFCDEVEGLELIEAIVVPRVDDEDDENDITCRLNLKFHADSSKYKINLAEGKKLLKTDFEELLDVNEDEEGSSKIFTQEILSSNDTHHVIQMLFGASDYGGVVDAVTKVLESPFHEMFWNKLMERNIAEGVCYIHGKVTIKLRDELRDNLNDLAKKIPVDFHPNSRDIVRDLIHPALYSYVNGISKVKSGCELPTENTKAKEDFWGRPYEKSNYQWLPTPFQISENGKCTITEYINNLDQNQFTKLYKNIEELFEVFLPYFEEVWSYIKSIKFYTNEDEAEDEEEESKCIEKLPKCFHGKELQVIVKIVDYTLQPQQEYEGVWHAEGMSHENIVMTGIYFLDRDLDLEGGDLRFKRAFTVQERNKVMYSVPQERPSIFNDFASEGFVPMGKFETKEGFLLVFPNCHIHKIAKLVNSAANKTASRRIVVFFVINPEKKIISTKEIAPQQNVILMSQAKAYRLELMAERKYDKEKLNVRDIELCEH